MRPFIWLVGLTVNLGIASLPTVLLSVALRPDPALAWLIAGTAIPVGPALCAGLRAVHSYDTEPDVSVTRAYWHGYRLTWRSALRLTAPSILVLGVITVTVGYGEDFGIPALYRGVLLGLGVLVVVGALHALAFASSNPGSALRLVQLAAYAMVKHWRVSLGLLALVAAALVTAALLSDLALVGLAGVWVWLYFRTVAPSLSDIDARLADEQEHEQEQEALK